MAEVLSFTLKFPFQNAAGDTISTLTIKRLKRKDISAAQTHTKDEAAMEDFLLAKMTGLTIEDLMDLDIADSKAVSEVFRGMADGRDLAELLGRGTVAGAKATAV
ncbi:MULTISPECIES: phage tail assembly protein [Pseudomonas]|uniref:phage tail assembly protein n=1 Tax=Pseudomonas TaxID=286 RepID=UPI000C88591C|nr:MULTISPECIES: phage tail assembly protein [Pseudomonas]PMY40110.1 phage tail assembly protein [Pseudomonas sp. FW306-2-2C-D06C]PYC41833.1 phage tail assembly protein [Pseudomonas chlororaphis]